MKNNTTSLAQKSANGKKIMWYNLAFMGFTTVWGFANIVNGYAYYGGLPAVLPWILVMALYFVPYALMVGELGATFKDTEGGVSSWILATTAPVFAFFAGWMYWVVHMPYLSQKPNQIMVAISQAIFQENKVEDRPLIFVAVVSFAIFLLAVFITTRGVNMIKKVATIAGICSFVLSMLFIVMIWAAPAIAHPQGIQDIKWSFDTFSPNMNTSFFTSLCVLILAVGGAEKIAPYVNQMKKPGKNFPKGMIAVAIMVAVCAILGTIALGMMFPAVTSDKQKQDLLLNGAYVAFEKLGHYYHVGNLFKIIYAITQAICFSAALIISIDAPLKILLDNSDKKYLPAGLLKKNKKGIYTNGLLLIVVIVGLLIFVPAFGIGNEKALNEFLTKINAVCMPLRYCWVFVAYYFLKKRFSKKESEYKFFKRKVPGMVIAAWCFLATLASCIVGMFVEKPGGKGVDWFQTSLNVIIPIILVCLGFVMMAVARITNNKEKKEI